MRSRAEKVAADVSPNPFNQTLVFAGLGDKDRTCLLDHGPSVGPSNGGLLRISHSHSVRNPCRRAFIASTKTVMLDVRPEK